MKTFIVLVLLAVPALAIGPGNRHDNQRGNGHTNHQGNGWGHHQKPPKCEECPRPHVHNVNRNNTNKQRQNQTQGQDQNQSLANSIDISLGGGGVVSQNIWRPIYQATPWNPPLAPIYPLPNYEQARPRAETYTAPPSFMYNGVRFVVME